MYRHQMHASKITNLHLPKESNGNYGIYKQKLKNKIFSSDCRDVVISRIARLCLGGKQRQDLEGSYRSSRRLLGMKLAKDGPELHQPRKDNTYRESLSVDNPICSWKLYKVKDRERLDLVYIVVSRSFIPSNCNSQARAI